MGKWLLKNDMDVSLVVFDKTAFALSQKLLSEVKAFIDEHYVGRHHEAYRRRQLLDVEREALAAKERIEQSIPFPASMPERALDDIIGRLDEPFSATLFRLIDAKGMTDVEVYKRANISRKVFSKIRTDKDYRPRKETIVAFAVALKLTLSETGDLLERAGLALSHSMMFDVIVEYFITRGKYDIFEINNVLYDYDQPILGEKARD